MSNHEIVSFLFAWGVIGCVAFSIFVVIAFRTGLVFTARKDDGTLKERVPIQGILAMTIIPIALLGLTLVSNYFGLVRNEVVLDFSPLFLLNFGIYVIFFIYDTLVIDGLVLGIWRPSFLNLPDAMGKESMSKHILISIPVGLLFGIILTLFNTALSHAIWMD
jgi:hypothetical protein